MLDKIVQIWRPSKLEQQPPYALKAENCFVCKGKEDGKEDWQEKHGQPEEWIEVLHHTPLPDCQSWLDRTLNIKWTQPQRKLLAMSYMRYVAILSGTEYKESTPDYPNDYTRNLAKAHAESRKPKTLKHQTQNLMQKLPV